MPSNKYTNKEKVVQKLKSLGVPKDKIEEVAKVVIEEAKSDEGNPEKLFQSIKNGAKSILADLGVEMVSYVENPSQDSLFTMMKDDSTYVVKESEIMKQKGEDWDVVYGPVMRPNDIDKDGDVATASDIEKAAHNFMAEGRVNQFDQDHDLNTGKGTMVESWILKEDKEYELPNGETEKIEKGTWMIGTKPSAEVKERIENGEITGWSIFGQADQIQLDKTPKSKNFNNDSEVNTVKEGNDVMSENPDNPDKKDSGAEETTLKEVKASIKSLEDSFNEFKEAPEPTTVKSVEDLQETLKSDKRVVELSEGFELEKQEASKEEDFEDVESLVSYLQDMLSESNFSMLQEMMKEYDDEDDEEEEDMEKQAKAKGSNGEGVRQSQNEVKKGSESSTGMSFQKVAQSHREEEA